MGDSGSSRKMVTRAWWLGMGSEEESRARLQERLVVLSQLLFWSFLTLLTLMFLLYRTFPAIHEPVHNNEIYGIGVLGMVFLVVIWRGALVRKQLSLRQLHAIDVFYAASSGLSFAASTCLAYDLKMAMTANILWSCLVVFLRTIVVPSTGPRSTVVASVVMVPMVASSAVLSYISDDQEFPPLALVGSTVVVAVVVALLATVGSRLIYDLRMQINAAMRLGSYTLDHKIGEGGNGTVYRAHHALLRRPAAVKLVRPDMVDAETLDRFELEVQHMSQLTHPNTVAVFDYGRSPDGVFYYAMEYLDGIDLEKLVTAFGPQPADRVTAILIQVCGALQEAHNRGIMHRDIKPANIILCERGEVPDVAKVVDFGLVKEITADPGDAGQTSRIFGTPSYVAPECITDPDIVGTPADIYGVGAVGYFLLTGRRVFEGKSAVEICIQHVTSKVVPPSQYAAGLARELEDIVLRCLAKSPKDRPTAAELASLLRALPAIGTWSEPQAVAWWKHLRENPVSTASSTQTLSITVDLKTRSAVLEHEAQ